MEERKNMKKNIEGKVEESSTIIQWRSLWNW